MAELLRGPCPPRLKIERKFLILVGDSFNMHFQSNFVLPNSVRLQMLNELTWSNWAFSHKLEAARLTGSLCKEAFEKSKAAIDTDLREFDVLYRDAVVYFESFLYFVLGALDVLASITAIVIYPNNKLSKWSFWRQMKNFLKNRNINSDYAQLLESNMQWIEDVKDNRDALTHRASPIVVIENSRLMFEKRKRDDAQDRYLSRRKFEDLFRYIDRTHESLYSFIEGYAAVHRKRVPVSDSAKMELEALDKAIWASTRSSWD